MNFWFVNNVTFPAPLAVVSLQHCARANSPAAWLRPVARLDESFMQGVRGEVCDAPVLLDAN